MSWPRSPSVWSASRAPWLTAVASALLATAAAAHQVTIVVNDAGDTLHDAAGGCALTGTGTCTLRDAITYANAHANDAGGRDQIRFGAAITQVDVLSPLPAIAEAVLLNGLSGAGPATVALDGSAGSAVDGLTLSGDGSLLTSLRVRDFAGSGVRVLGDDNVIGGPYCVLNCLGTGLVTLTGHGEHGISIDGAARTLVQSVDVASNGGDGIHVCSGASDTAVGAPGGLPFLSVHDNTGAGVHVGADAADVATTTTRITVTRLFGNGGLGIDLGGDGVTANDADDVDDGPSGLQNFPVLTGAVAAPGWTEVTGTFAGAADSTFELRFFHSATGDPSGFGEAEEILGSPVAVTTGALGQTNFTVSFPVALPPGRVITATATPSPLGGQGTSELSNAVDATALPATSFYTLTPCRAVDTRLPDGPLGGPRLLPGAERVFDIAGTCGVLISSIAVVVNVTAVGPSSLGHVTIGPAAAVPIQTSTVNFGALQTRANNAVVALHDGELAVSTTSSVDLLIDVVGYFE